MPRRTDKIQIDKDKRKHLLADYWHYVGGFAVFTAQLLYSIINSHNAFKTASEMVERERERERCQFGKFYYMTMFFEHFEFDWNSALACKWGQPIWPLKNVCGNRTNEMSTNWMLNGRESACVWMESKKYCSLDEKCMRIYTYDAKCCAVMRLFSNRKTLCTFRLTRCQHTHTHTPYATVRRVNSSSVFGYCSLIMIHYHFRNMEPLLRPTSVPPLSKCK